MLDDKILDRARRLIKVEFAKRRKALPKEVNRVIQEVQDIADTAQCSETFVRVHNVYAREVGTRIKIVFFVLRRVLKTHGSSITNTLATDLKEEVGHYIESTVEEVSENMRRRLSMSMSKSDARHFNFENTKREVKEEFDVEVDLYVDSLLCKLTDTEQEIKRRGKWVLNTQVGELLKSSPSNISANKIAETLNKNYKGEYKPTSGSAVSKTKTWTQRCKKKKK